MFYLIVLLNFCLYPISIKPISKITIDVKLWTSELSLMHSCSHVPLRAIDPVGGRSYNFLDCLVARVLALRSKWMIRRLVAVMKIMSIILRHVY